MNILAVSKIRHTGIVVSDLNRSLPFYRDLLGLEVWADFEDDSPYVQAVTGVPKARIRMIKLKAKDGGSIELLQYLSHHRPVPPPSSAFEVGCQHVAFQVGDLDALHARLAANEIKFHTPPLVSPGGDAKVTYCRDPEGVIIELVQLLP